MLSPPGIFLDEPFQELSDALDRRHRITTSNSAAKIRYRCSFTERMIRWLYRLRKNFALDAETEDKAMRKPSSVSA
ncbi:hypothetical protein NL676_005126 [Syzygium grande]|nr:hypothetical protein NL676_005126 [Syzygium grande]